MNILISACLLGVNCKYNGNNNNIEDIHKYIKGVNFIPVCPEQLGGLTTPRLPSEIQAEGIVVSKEGKDVTSEFMTGAEETLRIAKLSHCKYAIMKERSPSCGSSQIYDGSFQGNVKLGEGVAVALLKKHGVVVFSEENYKELFKEIL
jgi:uncharacterized protein YbbK (DUF523 family)